MEEVITTGSLREIWVSSQQSTAASCAYNESFSLTLHGIIDAKILKAALLQTLARRDAMSSYFSSDGTVMRKNADLPTLVAYHDIREKGKEERQAFFEKIVEREVSTPFDLHNGPLWRSHLLVQSDLECTLIFTAHHLICDGWSINLLIRDIGFLYDALKDEVTADLEKSVSFFNYVREMGLALTKERQDAVVEFWKSRFNPPLPVLDLPIDLPRPPQRTYNAHSRRCHIDREVVDKIKKTAASEGCNPFSYMLGAYAVLLWRLSGCEDLVIGVPVAGQGYYNNSDIVGHCVTMLPIRISVAPDTVFADFVAKLQDMLLDAYDYPECTFGDLIRELKIPRDPARVPLVPVGFTYAKLLGENEFGFSGLDASYTINSRIYETFEIYATVIDTGNGWELLWHFNSDLFDDITVGRWIEAYRKILGEAVDEPRMMSREFSIITASEWDAIHNEWERAERPFSTDSTVVDLFEKQVECTPKNVAVEFNERILTYEELKKRSDLLASFLIGSGAIPSEPIGFCVERSLEMVVCMLGILKAGAAYIPIDPSFPDERIAFILNDSKASMLISQLKLKQRFSDLNIPAIYLDNLPVAHNVKAIKPTKGNQRAYIIYTSGSTGKPKGVEIRHYSLVNFLLSMREKPGIGESDSLLAVTTISFDIAGLEIFLPLLCGARCILAEKDLSANGILLTEFLQNRRPSIMQATPATWEMLLASGWRDGKGMKVLCGGEAMTRRLADRLLATGAEVWNMYGPTETTIWSSLWNVVAGKKLPPIGKPIANTRLYILDDNFSHVPIGVVGELYIGGIGLALGYCNRPELTAEKFLDDPFPSSTYSNVEKRIYRTGDIGRMLADGNFEVLGRSDFQVKIRGFRIELGEIESTLYSFPMVKECVVTDGVDVKENRILIAYVVFHENKNAVAEDLRSLLRRTLPDYMIPTLFIFLDSLPRLINNKIDRKALPLPSHSRGEIEENYIAPRNETEKSLNKIWKDILGIDKISISDNFFDLGGHSLLAVMVIAKIEEVFDVIVPLSSISEAQTIRDLAKIVIDKCQIRDGNNKK
ncbi:MAG: amino acid adenylation domain-containing protein [Candidatus Latescibacteria bacterium]|nr:amino acid adenylation domain-containing protein [Candidatus Latescibacterota bacterium]